MNFKGKWSVILCLAIGNFLWQFILYACGSEFDFHAANDRSYFQGVAVLITCHYFRNRKEIVYIYERVYIQPDGSAD